VTLIKEAFVGLIGLFISLELYVCDMAIHQRGMTFCIHRFVALISLFLSFGGCKRGIREKRVFEQ